MCFNSLLLSFPSSLLTLSPPFPFSLLRYSWPFPPLSLPTPSFFPYPPTYIILYVGWVLGIPGWVPDTAESAGWSTAQVDPQLPAQKFQHLWVHTYMYTTSVWSTSVHAGVTYRGEGFTRRPLNVGHIHNVYHCKCIYSSIDYHGTYIRTVGIQTGGILRNLHCIMVLYESCNLVVGGYQPYPSIRIMLLKWTAGRFYEQQVWNNQCQRTTAHNGRLVLLCTLQTTWTHSWLGDVTHVIYNCWTAT